MAPKNPPPQFASTRWDAEQYLQFSDHRLRPALELLARIPLESPSVIYDLGCGTGNVTRIISERWPRAAVCGIDSSKDMLAKAVKESRRVSWVEADVREWAPSAKDFRRPTNRNGKRTGQRGPAAAPDLIYSNATLHWVENHRELFPRLAGYLKPGGCLAVQMPLSWSLPSHRLTRETLENGGAGGAPLGPETLRQTLSRDWVDAPDAYFEYLSACAKKIDIWQTEYLQVLEGQDAVLEWVKGTGLRPVLNGLADAERAAFLAEYTRRLRVAYPIRSDGRTLYPFRRLFIIATV